MEGGDHQRGQKGGDGNLSSVGPFSFAGGFLHPPEKPGKDRMDNIQGKLMTSSFLFLCSLKACTTALVCSAKGLLCCGRCCKNSEQLMLHKILSLQRAMGGQKTQAPAPHIWFISGMVPHLRSILKIMFIILQLLILRGIQFHCRKGRVCSTE